MTILEAFGFISFISISGNARVKFYTRIEGVLVFILKQGQADVCKLLLTCYTEPHKN